MKKIILLSLVMIASFGANAQKLDFKINELKDTTIFLAKYLGPKLYYADTTQSKGGKFSFDGSKHPRGLYAVVIPGTRYFEFIIDKEDVNMEVANKNDLIGTMKVNKSVNNKVFYEFIMFMTDFKKKSGQLNNEYQAATGREGKGEHQRRNEGDF
jgi:hypothetical protein